MVSVRRESGWYRQLQLTVTTPERPQTVTRNSSTFPSHDSLEMDNTNNVPRPELIHKLEGCTDEVNGAVIIPGKSRRGLYN